MEAVKVERGIFIDMGCKGITHIPAGYFIPLQSSTADTSKAYQHDLEQFMARWFPSMQSGESSR